MLFTNHTQKHQKKEEEEEEEEKEEENGKKIIGRKRNREQGNKGVSLCI